jgi:hypothetical protein
MAFFAYPKRRESTRMCGGSLKGYKSSLLWTFLLLYQTPSHYFNVSKIHDCASPWCLPPPLLALAGFSGNKTINEQLDVLGAPSILSLQIHGIWQYDLKSNSRKSRRQEDMFSGSNVLEEIQ